MVLEKLGENLKATLSKIAGSLFVDEKLVNELVKDIQRALLQADVNVKLVFELSNKIKERALKQEPPAGLTKKEFLINIVYEELTNFLGGEGHKIDVNKKPYTIMLTGLFGNGKCVHKDSNILLWDGQTITAEKLYSIYKEKGEFALDTGFIVPLEYELYVPSLNVETLKIEKKRISHLWRLHGKELMEVLLDNGNGFTVKTTPEHPFFILAQENIKQKRADELKQGDYIAIPVHYVSEPKYWDFTKRLRELNLDIYVPLERIKKIKEDIIAKYGSLKNALAQSSYDRNYIQFTQALKQGKVPIQLVLLKGEEKIIVKHYVAQDTVAFPTKITRELAEFIGYVIGDGYLSKNSVHISNEDIEVIERVKILSKSLFLKTCSLTRDKRTKKLVHLRINSKTIVHIIHTLFLIPIGKKGRNLEVPQAIQEADLEAARYFLRAYFDCDAHFSLKQRQIDIISESKILIKQVHHMLLRFNILGTQAIKKVGGKDYYRMCIHARHALQFSESIYSLIKRKQIALDSYATMTIKQGDGKQDMIPVGSLLRRLREVSGYSLAQIQHEVSSYGLYEKKQRISRSQLQKVLFFYERKEKANLGEVLKLLINQEVKTVENNLNKGLFNAIVNEYKKQDLVAEMTNSPTKFVLTEKGKRYYQNISDVTRKDIMGKLKKLAYSNLVWIKVKEVKKIKNESEYVYDLTVEGNHNFIADGVIVHNTTTAAKLAKFFQKRGNKVALIQTDTWRPAAYDQLVQLGSQINADVFGNKAEKDPVKIYKTFAPELHKYNIVIVDTAGRDALSEDLIDELKKMNAVIQPDETLLVMSADIGQAAEKQARAFHETCHVTGVIITKLDGTAKGGGALIACSVTGAPVKFIGVGEKIDAFEEFKPKNFVGRLLGMGDIEALLEKAKEAVTEEEAQDMSKKFLSGKFNLLDLYQQMEAMSKMGSLGRLMEMIPGMGQLQLPKDMIEVQEEKLKKWKFILNSCTKKELEEPDDIDSSRAVRIAKGSGTEPTDVNDLLKQYKQAKKMTKMLGGGSPKAMEKMMKRMGGKIPGLGNLQLK